MLSGVPADRGLGQRRTAAAPNPRPSADSYSRRSGCSILAGVVRMAEARLPLITRPRQASEPLPNGVLVLLGGRKVVHGVQGVFHVPRSLPNGIRNCEDRNMGHSYDAGVWSVFHFQKQQLNSPRDTLKRGLRTS